MESDSSDVVDFDNYIFNDPEIKYEPIDMYSNGIETNQSLILNNSIINIDDSSGDDNDNDDQIDTNGLSNLKISSVCSLNPDSQFNDSIIGSNKAIINRRKTTTTTATSDRNLLDDHQIFGIAKTNEDPLLVEMPSKSSSNNSLLIEMPSNRMKWKKPELKPKSKISVLKDILQAKAAANRPTKPSSTAISSSFTIEAVESESVGPSTSAMAYKSGYSGPKPSTSGLIMTPSETVKLSSRRKETLKPMAESDISFKTETLLSGIRKRPNPNMDLMRKVAFLRVCINYMMEEIGHSPFLFYKPLTLERMKIDYRKHKNRDVVRRDFGF